MKNMTIGSLGFLASMLLLAGLGVATPGNAAINYCNQNYDPIVGVYSGLETKPFDASQTTDLSKIIGIQMMLHGDGTGVYDDSTHHGHGLPWDPVLDQNTTVVSTDGYLSWKKSGGQYKVEVLLTFGFPSPLDGTVDGLLNGYAAFPSLGWMRGKATGTAYFGDNKCRTLIVDYTDCAYPINDMDLTNPIRCGEPHQVVFYKRPPL